MLFKIFLILLLPFCAEAQRRTSDNSTLTKCEVNTIIATATTAADAKYCAKVNNLSDVNAATARTNLGVATTANIASSTNKNFVTDAQLTVVGNTSGTNTGDNAANSTYANDYRAANFVAGTNYLAPNGSAASLTNNNGGWTTLRVATTDFTTTSTTLADVTGLVSSSLSTATLYEFEATLYVNSTSTAGMTIGVDQTGTGTGQVGVISGTATSGAATGMAIGSNALNTASAPCVLVNGDGTITIRGYIKTGSAGTPTIKIKVAKATSGTAKVYIGSVFRYRIAQ